MENLANITSIQIYNLIKNYEESELIKILDASAKQNIEYGKPRNTLEFEFKENNELDKIYSEYYKTVDYCLSSIIKNINNSIFIADEKTINIINQLDIRFGNLGILKSLYVVPIYELEKIYDFIIQKTTKELDIKEINSLVNFTLIISCVIGYLSNVLIINLELSKNPNFVINDKEDILN